MKPHRPALLKFAGVRELYLHFERIFLKTAVCGEIQSTCGHTLMVFDHHFFHMVKLTYPGKLKLFMSNEKAFILDIPNGFGPYTYENQRAIYLESAKHCLSEPDEVWEDETLDTAKWIYIKEFSSTPYSCTIALVGRRGEDIVPVTSFPGKKRDARKWRKGRQIYPLKHNCRPD